MMCACALFVVLLCPLTVETYEEVSSLRKELPNEEKRLLFYRLSKRMKCLVETG